MSLKPKTLLCLVVVALLSLSSSCKKDDPPGNELPPLTHEGKNTFGCKINGENWAASTPSSINGPSPLHGEWENPSGRFSLHAVLKENEPLTYQYLDLDADSVFEVGNYKNLVFYGNNELRVGFNQYSGNYNCQTYYFDALNPGNICITYFDSMNSIIAGTFSMTLKNPDCQDSLMYITDGRFDLKY